MSKDDALGALFIIASNLSGEADIRELDEHNYFVGFEGSTANLVIRKDEATMEEIQETIREARS